MVALLTPNTFESERFVPDIGEGQLRRQSQRRPDLRVLQGGLDAHRNEIRRIDSSIVIGFVAVVLVIAGILSVRVSQGVPPAEFETSPAVSGGFVPVVEAGELLEATGFGS